MSKIKDIPPCYKCEDRQAGCHGKCKRYQEWREKQQEEAARIYVEKHKSATADTFLVKGTLKRRQKWERTIKK